jgi:hypothetical protein
MFVESGLLAESGWSRSLQPSNLNSEEESTLASSTERRTTISTFLIAVGKVSLLPAPADCG